jgi:hypothetical protein
MGPQLARGALYGVGSVDTVTLVEVIAVLNAVVLSATCRPARQVIRTDPSQMMKRS